MRFTCTNSCRNAAAHDIIRNDDDLSALRDQVEKLHRAYLAAAAAQAEKETT